MINAVLYSDQIIPENANVDRHMVEMMEGRDRRIGYIPSGPDLQGRFVEERRNYYGRYGLEIALVYDLDYAHAPTAIDELFACDAIHLSGGDTTAFLRRLRHSGMVKKLQD